MTTACRTIVFSVVIFLLVFSCVVIAEDTKTTDEQRNQGMDCRFAGKSQTRYAVVAS